MRFIYMRRPWRLTVFGLMRFVDGAIIGVNTLQDMGYKGTARVGRCYAIVVAIKESFLDFALDQLEPLAERRLRNADALRGLGEGAFFVQGDHQFEIAYLQLACHCS